MDNTGAKSFLFEKAVIIGDASASKSEMTFGKRLEDLSKEEVEDIMSEMSSAKNSSKLPKTGSLEVLLSQYLETSDYSQVNNILNVSNRKVYFVLHL